ncbi:MAG TPA: hypothetical protein IAB49_06465 [Candidatus Caccenecus avistercoris]|nr:hypothetical protein [Candidatus Caccenecus avistercoris]
MNNKKYMILLISTIAIVVIAATSVTYAYLSYNATQTDENIVTTSCFDISYSDSDSISLNSNGNYAYPMSEDSANRLTPYSFTITNTCTTTNSTDPINYVVTLNTLTSSPSTIELSKVRYRLDMTNPTSSTGTSALMSEAATYDLSAAIKSSEGIDTSYNLVEGTLAPGASVTYNLRLWIDEAAGNEVMNQTFNGRILVYSYL